MKRLGWLILGWMLALAPLVHADDWSKTYTLSGQPELRVEASDANIKVDTWDQNTIQARVTTTRDKIGSGGVQIIEHQTGDSVELEVREPHHYFTIQIGSSRIEVEIHMPRQGHLKVHTGDGSIELSGLKGDMDLETGDGHQEINAVDGTLKARSGDGHISAAGRFDGLQIETGDGRVEARAQAGSTMASNWELRTGDGGVRLQIPENFAADVDLHTSDGHINVDLPVAVEGRLGERNIHGKMNGGGNLLTIHTGDGSISIDKL
jgi:DUF4097 and DUF4098 domain-containing protein YvlB